MDDAALGAILRSQIEQVRRARGLWSPGTEWRVSITATITLEDGEEYQVIVRQPKEP
jgi:hypothetical protein